MELSGPTGGCYGFEVDADLDLRYLRESGSLESLRVRLGGADPAAPGRVLLDWPARPGRPVAVRLHEAAGGYALWIEDAGWFHIDLDGMTITLPQGGDALRTEERLWGMPSLLTFMHRGGLPLHGGAVEFDGGAVIYTAPTRFGKTTLSARLWSDGHRLLTEDLCRIQLEAGPAVLAGPAMLRLRHDIAAILTVPDSVEVGRDGDRVHLGLSGPRVGDSSPVPLAGVVILREGPEVRLDRLEPTEALRDLWAVTFHLPEREAIVFQQLADLLDATPVWNLSRPLTMDALDSTCRLITEVRHARAGDTHQGPVRPAVARPGDCHDGGGEEQASPPGRQEPGHALSC